MGRKADPNKLSLREDVFVARVVGGESFTAAAEHAGYSAETAGAKGSELAKRPRVAAAIEAAKARIVKKLGVRAERVVEEMAVIGFSDVRHYAVALDGSLFLADGAPESAMRAVKSVRIKRKVVQTGEQSQVLETETHFELWSKDTQLRNLGDHLKMFKENRAEDDDEGMTVAEHETRAMALLRKAARMRKAAMVAQAAAETGE